MSGSRSFSGECVVSLYDFKATEPDQLSFTTGQVVQVLLKESEWWLGKIGAQSGLFPSNYVKSLPKQPCAIALFDFVAEFDTQLSFKKGDLLVLKEKDEGGWYDISYLQTTDTSRWTAEQIKQPGRSGLVPSNYIKEIVLPNATLTTQVASKSIPSASSLQTREEQSVQSESPKNIESRRSLTRSLEVKREDPRLTLERQRIQEEIKLQQQRKEEELRQEVEERKRLSIERQKVQEVQSKSHIIEEPMSLDPYSTLVKQPIPTSSHSSLSSFRSTLKRTEVPVNNQHVGTASTSTTSLHQPVQPDKPIKDEVSSGVTTEPLPNPYISPSESYLNWIHSQQPQLRELDSLGLSLFGSSTASTVSSSSLPKLAVTMSSLSLDELKKLQQEVYLKKRLELKTQDRSATNWQQLIEDVNYLFHKKLHHLSP